MHNRKVFRSIAKYILERMPTWPAGVLLGCLLLFPATHLLASITVLVGSLGAAVFWSTRVPELLTRACLVKGFGGRLGSLGYVAISGAVGLAMGVDLGGSAGPDWP